MDMEGQPRVPAKAREYVLEARDMREEQRLKTAPLAVRVVGECRRTYGYARDISPSGMQIRTFMLCDDWPKPVGERIRIEFSIPDKGFSISCGAKVMWERAPLDWSGSMLLQGVRFEDIDPALRERLGELASAVN